MDDDIISLSCSLPTSHSSLCVSRVLPAHAPCSHLKALLWLFFPQSFLIFYPLQHYSSPLPHKHPPIIDLTLLLRSSLLAERLFNPFPTIAATLRIRHDSLFTYISRTTSTPVSIPSVDIAYHLHGRGPQKLVFISGMCVSHSMWSHQLAAFRRNQNYTILLIDNRGSGASSVPPASFTAAPGYDIPTMARDALAVIDTVFGREASFHLVGHSMGSMIAQRLALVATRSKHQQRLASLTLLSGHDGGWFWNNCPTPIMLLAFVDLVRTGFDDHVTANVHLRMHYTDRFLEEMLIDDNTGEKVLRRDAYYKRYLDGIRKNRKRDGGGNAFWGHLAAVRTHNLTNDEASILRNADFPKIVVYGEEDQVVLPRASRELALRIGAEGIGVAASHFIIDEAAHDVNKILLFNFERGIRPATGEGNTIPRWDWLLLWASEEKVVTNRTEFSGRRTYDD